MKKLVTGIWIMILSISAKAADMAISPLAMPLTTKDVASIAKEGTGTCDIVDPRTTTSRSIHFDRLRLSQVREMLKASQSIEERELILERVLQSIDAE